MIPIHTTIRHHSNSIVLDGMERIVRNLRKSCVAFHRHAAKFSPLSVLRTCREQKVLKVAYISLLRLVPFPLRTIILPAGPSILSLPCFCG